MSRKFLRATLNKKRSSKRGVELTDDGQIVPTPANIADGTLAVNGDRILHTPHGKTKTGEDEEKAFSRQRNNMGPLSRADYGFVEMLTFGMCRSACCNLFNENLSFGMNDQLL